jgi:hypothetical protein
MARNNLPLCIFGFAFVLLVAWLHVNNTQPSRTLISPCRTNKILVPVTSRTYMQEIADEAFIFNSIIPGNKINGTVIVANSNYAFRTLTLNWIASLRRNNYDKFVVFSFDSQLAEFLAERGFQDNVAVVPAHWLDQPVPFVSAAADWHKHTDQFFSLVKACALCVRERNRRDSLRARSTPQTARVQHRVLPRHGNGLYAHTLARVGLEM